MMHFASNLNFKVTAKLRTNMLKQKAFKFQHMFSTHNNVLYISIFVAFNALCQIIIYVASILNLKVMILCCDWFEFGKRLEKKLFFKIRKIVTKDFAINCN